MGTSLEVESQNAAENGNEQTRDKIPEPKAVEVVDGPVEEKRADLKSGTETTAPDVSFLKLFSFADSLDYVLMAIGTLGAMAHGLAFPMFFFFFGKIVNGFGSNRDDPNKTLDDVSKNALYLVYLGIVVGFSGWAEVACWMHTGQRQAAKMRRMYLQATLRQDVGFFDTDARTGMLVDSMSKDTALVQEAISEKVGNFLHYMTTFVGGFAVGFSAVWKLCLVTIAVVPAIAFAGGLYAFTISRLASKGQAAYGQAGTIAEQAISQIRTVYSFVGEKKAVQSYSETLAVTLKLGYRGGLAKGLGMGGTYSILLLSWALILWYGGFLIRHGETTGGKAVTAIFSVIIGGMAIGQSMSSVPSFSKGKAAAATIFDILNKPVKMDRREAGGTKLAEVKGDVELRNVVFHYPSRPDVNIFNGFSLVIPSGKTVAIVGSSGSGKSTVVSLIERFYDPVEGEILLDGTDIRSFQLSWLRDQIGLVNQEPALFATTIVENILYGKEGATMQEVEAASKAANAHDFISELPNGYETQVGERGTQLSGGQKQRVAIARAMLKNPRVLLLDEATSALDTASERVVQDALDRLMVGRTTVIVAHRLSTIRGVDSINVVQDGEIVEMGTHDELIAKGELGAYSTLVKLQEMALASDGTILGRTSKAAITSGTGSSFRSGLSRSRRGSGDLRLSGAASESVHSEDGRESVKVQQGAKPKQGVFIRLLKMNAPEWPYAIPGCLGAVLAGLINPSFAFAISELISVYYYTDFHKMKEKVETYVFVFVCLGVLSMGIYVLQHYFFGIVGENLTARVREKMFSAMLRNEIGWFDLGEHSSVRLAARLASDATLVRAALGDRASLIIQNFTVFITASIVGFVLQWRMTLVLLATFPFLVAASLTQLLTVKGFAGNLNEAHARSTMIAGDAISNIRTVAAFNAEDKVLGLFSAALSGPNKRSFIRGNLSGFFFGMSQLSMYSSYGLVLWYGATLVKNGQSDFGSVIKLFMVLFVTAFAIAETLSLTPDISKGGDALVSVFEVIDRETKIDPEDPKAEVVEKVVGDIELVNVEFSYPTRPEVPIFRGLTLRVNSGDSLALVGASGSGKSSVVSLILRFYDTNAGKVLIDGKDIRRLNLRSLRTHIGLVQQEPALFADTIYENILYGCENATQGDIEAVAKAANAHNFISGLPGGYQTQVGERGVQLSGGQKQRVAIARAMLKNPTILLLDEATSALDAESEKVVQEALDRLMEGRTTVVVAHRLSTIRNASTIAVIQEGRVIEQGSHSELMNRHDGSYARLVNIQSRRT